MQGTSSGGNGPMVSYQRGMLGVMTIIGNTLPTKIEQQMKGLLDPLFPDKIDLPNTRFTEIKKDALAVLCEKGRLFHVKMLEAIGAKAIEEKEINAIDETIAKIKERGV